MAINLVQGDLLPKHQSFDNDAQARAFWRLTYETGRNYITGIDASGGKILIPHEREKEGYGRRLRMTKPRNHAGPIIRRYNSHIFRIEAARAKTTSKIYQTLLTDIDGNGSSVNDFMARALEMAQVQREAYLLLDSNKSGYAEMSVAQAELTGVRNVVKLIEPDSVYDWREFNGSLVEVLVVMCREDGTDFARLYNKDTYTEVELKRGKEDASLKIASVGEPVKHGYKGLPVIRLRPFNGESQISPLAESQQCITNLISWLIEELANVTFSQSVVSGVSATDVGQTYVGNNRLICLPNPASSWNVIGADPAQAESLRKAIEDEQRELYRIAGISTGDPTSAGAPESGVAKAFKHNDLSANLSALAACVEAAENRAMNLLFGSMSEPYPGDAKYPDNFDLPSITDDLSEVISVVTVSALPNTIKKKLTERFAQRHLSLSDKEEKAFKTELDSLSADPLTNQLPGMGDT